MCYNIPVEDTHPKNLISVITDKLTGRPSLLDGVMKIAMTIEKSGMSLEDCTLLARMSPQELSDLSAEIPEIPLYFRLKRVQYKEKLIEVLHAQATENKDVKIAMYLLESNFSDEYSAVGKKEMAKAKAKENGSDLEKLLQKVREAAPNSPVIEANTQAKNDVGASREVLDLQHLVHG